MSHFQSFLQGVADFSPSALSIIGHFIETFSVEVILQLAERLHRLVEVVVDNGKAIAAVLKQLPARESEILGVVHQIETSLQYVGTSERGETVQVKPYNQIGIVSEKCRQLVVDYFIVVVQLVELCESEVEVVIPIII